MILRITTLRRDLMITMTSRPCPSPDYSTINMARGALERLQRCEMMSVALEWLMIAKFPGSVFYPNPCQTRTRPLRSTTNTSTTRYTPVPGALLTMAPPWTPLVYSSGGQWSTGSKREELGEVRYLCLRRATVLEMKTTATLTATRTAYTVSP
ncbi:hypothetical protein EMPG_17110 [Blastomyces silverae]|uniref:Uncharacterized protein n=1 Tax=Blastomyces silverae TaxID=2060906 RepID=A0A0H1B7Q4_9EURO|nr:hypothetical protein EMPG_17110 [Blastomyces silverae]